jgi:hypothetical protein
MNEEECDLRLHRLDYTIDAGYKRPPLSWEPWKAMSAAFLAGVIAASAFITLFIWIAAN